MHLLSCTSDEPSASSYRVTEEEEGGPAGEHHGEAEIMRLSKVSGSRV